MTTPTSPPPAPAVDAVQVVDRGVGCGNVGYALDADPADVRTDAAASRAGGDYAGARRRFAIADFLEHRQQRPPHAPAAPARTVGEDPTDEGAAGPAPSAPTTAPAPASHLTDPAPPRSRPRVELHQQVDVDGLEVADLVVRVHPSNPDTTTAVVSAQRALHDAALAVLRVLAVEPADPAGGTS